MFVCNFCNIKFFILRKYNAHLYLHRSLKCYKYVCYYEKCSRKFESYAKFKNHIFRNHAQSHSQKTRTLRENNFMCSIETCNAIMNCYETLKSHCYNHIQSGISIQCPLKIICHHLVFYENINSLKSHFYRNHDLGHDILINYDETQNENENCSENICDIESSQSKDESIAEMDVITSNDENLQTSYEKTIASLYLMLQAKYYMSDEILQVIINGIRDLEELNIKHNLQKDVCESKNYLSLFQITHIMHYKEYINE